jgi:toxin ParE1/3/4
VTTVLFRPEAEADLLAIAMVIAESRPQRALDVVERLRKRCEILARLPYAGRPREELGPGLRSLVERPYVILYRVDGAVAEIVAIIHGARDLPAALAKRFIEDIE